MRIVPLGYDSRAIHVDVFYLIGVPNDTEEQMRFRKRIAKLFYVREAKMKTFSWQTDVSLIRNVKRFIWFIFEKMMYMSENRERAELEYDQYCRKYKLSETTYCVAANLVAASCKFDTEKLWNTRLIELPTGVFRITNDYDAVLRTIYNDYRTIPSLESRIHETMMSYQRICLFDASKEMMASELR